MLQRKSNYGADWEEVREWILEREGHQCWECGSERRLHVHHIEKLVWFETTDEAHQPKNLVALCEHCHRDLENQPEHFQTVMADA